ncbi:hypothetical protein E1281_38965 [Actinomadura sp. KC345]|uniref:hypothetical protein n=1 Tax=Actinomadura sp. KC345 TaxID=2530371 RepID=UPI00104BD69B|nr:hypothetical protein [Actinomadura sp. KC345]TDC38854.1 hypothetical protein E1281_38965 [Actinomadura sp. KC345]
MNELVALLLLHHLFPEWGIMRDGEGVWRAVGPALISAPGLDGLLGSLATADRDAARRAVSLLPSG